MLYKPNYCCNCGEKIERVNWSLTASRRFCDVCKSDFVAQEWLPKVFIAVMAIIGIFGAGSYLRSGEKPVNVLNKQPAAASTNPNKNPANYSTPGNAGSNIQQLTQTNNVQTNTQTAPQTQNLTTKPQVKQVETAPIEAQETVYFCGAPTKKGTPCSRRVKGGGRCWQHKGQTALLPPEKLIASQ